MQMGPIFEDDRQEEEKLNDVLHSNSVNRIFKRNRNIVLIYAVTKYQPLRGVHVGTSGRNVKEFSATMSLPSQMRYRGARPHTETRLPEMRVRNLEVGCPPRSRLMTPSVIGAQSWSGSILFPITVQTFSSAVFVRPMAVFGKRE